jgi:hypothetical protein
MGKYGQKTFGIKKACLEQANRAFTKGKGGWFGLTHKSLKTHWELFGSILRPRSPFLVVEREKDVYNNIKWHAARIKDPRIKVLYGDVFECLFGAYPHSPCNTVQGKSIYRVPLFTYGHLDFCCSALTLQRDGFEQRMYQLSRWWNLKDRFHLDVTVSKRGDKKGFRTAKLLLEMVVPNIFEQASWIVEDVQVMDYCDTSAMRNVFCILKRKNRWRVQRTYYDSKGK